ncbi:MAG: hypothetical protein HDT13_06755 [Butyrivibrio sp.]|nr:hypothetical protein [Butyrivibrio sp.]
MFFLRIKSKVKLAMVRFCMAQPNVGINYTAREVEKLVDNAFATLNRFTGVTVTPAAVEGYTLYANGKKVGKSFHDLAKNVGIISDSAVFLGTLFNEEKSDVISGKQITHCYDLFYDDAYDEIRMVYRVEISDDDFTAVYRAEVFGFEKFDLFDFIRAAALQIADMLEKKRKKEDF